MPNPITVAIVEDDAEICSELEQIVVENADLRCVAVCRNLQTALRKIPPLNPDVLVMDIRLPDGSGIDGAQRMKRQIPAMQILIFTIYDDNEQIFRALKAGASGYLLKWTSAEELVRAIHEVKGGGSPMTPEVARKVIESFQRNTLQADTPDRLTRREEDILELLTKGLVPKEIAEDLSISVQTVRSHLKSVYSKLHVRTRTEAVLKFLQ